MDQETLAIQEMALMRRAVAARHNAGKAPMHHVAHFGPGLQSLAYHCAAGQRKYPDTPEGLPNWRLGGKPDSEYISAIDRHWQELGAGEWYDRETGTPHAAAIVWNALALITMNHPEELYDRQLDRTIEIASAREAEPGPGEIRSGLPVDGES